MKTSSLKVKAFKKTKKKIVSKQVKPVRFLSKLPALNVIFENSENQRIAIDAIWSLYSYVWEGLPYSKTDYNQGIWASLMNAGVDNVIQITDEISLLLSEFNRYVGRADALYPDKVRRILGKLSNKIADDLLFRKIDPWILRDALVSESLYIWKMAGLKGVADNYKVLRNQFDMTHKFKRLQSKTYQVLEYFNDPEKESRELIRAIVECGWALSYRDDSHFLNAAT